MHGNRCVWEMNRKGRTSPIVADNIEARCHAHIISDQPDRDSIRWAESGRIGAALPHWKRNAIGRLVTEAMSF